ncbi:MAG: hypothetical protein AAGA77_18885 [Bacteroidota bacterium]
MKIHKAPVVQALISYYHELLMPKREQTILDHLSLISKALCAGLAKKVHCLYAQLNNYNPNFIGIPIENLKRREFNLSECKHTIAKEYGFDDWDNVRSLDKTMYNLAFEHCVTAITTGDLITLESILTASPSLIHKQSQYGHKASLIHYTASNGIELWRQQVPNNLVSIIRVLIENGADRQAKMNVYNGQFTAYDLYTSSAHPKDAGISEIAKELLKP